MPILGKNMSVLALISLAKWIKEQMIFVVDDKFFMQMGIPMRTANLKAGH